jgi:hypothetical protein
MVNISTLRPFVAVSWHREGVHDPCRSVSPVATPLGASSVEGPGLIAPSRLISLLSYDSKSDQVFNTAVSIVFLEIQMSNVSYLSALGKDIFSNSSSCVHYGK